MRDDVKNRTEAARAERGRKAVRDRRRCQVGRPASGIAAVVAASGQEGTLYPSALREPVDGPVLKDGNNLSKIGGQVLVGWLKGAKIVTLTLEERATCPRSCEMWRRCYGNSSPFTHRYRHGPELEAALEREVAALCEKHDQVLVRLHLLGDFYSGEYIALWQRLLGRHEGLHVFGFTAWPEKTVNGSRIAWMRDVFGMRWSVRHSGRGGEWGSFTIDWPTERKVLGDAVVCPEQLSANAGPSDKHCGNCGICWSTAAPIVFIEH